MKAGVSRIELLCESEIREDAERVRVIVIVLDGKEPIGREREENV